MVKKRGMNFRVFLVVSLLLSLFILTQNAFCAHSGQYTADFLNIAVDARSTAMGGAYTALAQTASATYWNPGGLTQVNARQILFSHFAWYQDITFEYVSATYPLGEKFAAGFSASYVNYGTIEGYDEHDNPTGPLASTYDFSGGFSLGWQASDVLSLGATVKYIDMSLNTVSGSTVAFDLGSQLRFDKLQLGAMIGNIGGAIAFPGHRDNLPTTIRLGASYYMFNDAILGSVEVEKRKGEGMMAKGGIEYRFDRKFFVRTGYQCIPGQHVRTLDRSFSLGMGLLWGKTQIDYTYSPSYLFQSEETHRFTLIFNL